MFITCIALRCFSVPWQGWLTDFRAGTFVLGCVCLWSKLLIWESFIFINPISTECQHRPMTLTSLWNREPGVASFSFICHHWRQRGTCSRQLLASGSELGELFSLSIEISRGTLQPLQVCYSFPCWMGNFKMPGCCRSSVLRDCLKEIQIYMDQDHGSRCIYFC